MQLLERPANEGTFVGRQLALRIAALPRGLVPALEATTGHLDANANAEYSVTLRAGHCYRAVAVGGIDTQELSLSIIDDQQRTLVEDHAQEPWVSLGDTRPLCPASTGTFSVRVRLASGGDYGVFIAGTP